MANKKQTGKALATKASKILRTKSSSEIQKTLAGGVLSQSSNQKQTGKEMEKIASDILKSEKYNNETKSLAASLVSQSNKNR